ncbi:hypothetical protein AAG565_08585 [Fontimonas sp. SYSU GA230001]|uniref:hypothetical protein n=1 Tax=Fontimonas sp. SYSU GA230001 TaxID=3142450 RepID=UPI0032B594BA
MKRRSMIATLGVVTAGALLWGAVFPCAAQGFAARAQQESAGEAGLGAIQIWGAVASPGSIALSIERYLGFSAALASAGGLAQSAYLLGAVLLREQRVVAAVAASGKDCLGADVLQTLAVIEDIAVDSSLRIAIRKRLIEGSLRRVPLPKDFARWRGQKDIPIELIDGDILLVPRTLGFVYVQHGQGVVARVEYRPGGLAEDYTRSIGIGGRVFSGDDLIVFPDGRAQALRLNFWSYEPTPVPPGSLLIVDAQDRHCLAAPGRAGE